MKVLVTGGCGFIGNYVVKELQSRRHEVTVADNLSKEGAAVPDGARFIRVDLTDPKATLEAFKGMDACINMASKIGGIGYFHKHPAMILSENNKIYSSTFDAAVAAKIRRMVYLSSSMVFESTDRFPSKESDVTEIPPPLTGYGFSKLVGEYYCRTYNEEHGLEYTIIRPFNAYGINEYPGDYVGYSHVIPDLTKKIVSGQYPLEILGDGEQTRCLTHVKDIARGIVMALESDKAGDESFNLGTQEETRMIDLAKLLWKICGRKEEFKVKHLPSFKYDIRKRVPDTSKAKEVLGWEQEIPLEKGLPEVVGWLRRELI